MGIQTQYELERAEDQFGATERDRAGAGSQTRSVASPLRDHAPGRQGFDGTAAVPHPHDEFAPHRPGGAGEPLSGGSRRPFPEADARRSAERPSRRPQSRHDGRSSPATRSAATTRAWRCLPGCAQTEGEAGEAMEIVTPTDSGRGKA
jgi:hypothetical protein